VAWQTTIGSEIWQPNQRSGLIPDVDTIDKTISVPLNLDSPDDGFFDLYYFVQTPLGGLGTKTVLFCAGGPGEIARDVTQTYAGFLIYHDYNVVTFHLRGVGFSQLPPSNEFDKFLKTSYAVGDVEKIRCDLLGEYGKWDGIIAMSYGTVLAQQYAQQYPKKVSKLVLVSPISRHKFNDVPNAFDVYYDASLRIYRQNLRSIYDSDKEEFQNEFGDLTADQKNRIIEEVFGSPDTAEKKGIKGIFQRTEEAFGSIQFVIDEYSRLKSNELKLYQLDNYSENFFRQVRELRFYGPSAINDGPQQEIIRVGKVIRDQVLYGQQNALDETLFQHVQGHQRLTYAMAIQDGANWLYLKERIANYTSNSRNALKAIGGDANKQRNVNIWLEKVKIDDQHEIRPWDPSEYRHHVPTLVLDGKADPVTACGQAEHIYSKALAGPRTLIRFPGSGHQIALPAVEEEGATVPIVSGTIRVSPPAIPAGEVRDVICTVTGRKLDENLGIVLEPPPDLKGVLQVRGCCVLEKQEVKRAGQKTKEKPTKIVQENMVALIENHSSRAMPLKGTEWTEHNAFFQGTVSFVRPNRIGPRKVQLAYGTLVGGRKNEDYEIRVHPREDLEPDLNFIGFNILPPDGLQLWIENTNGTKAVDGAVRDWIIESGKPNLRFRMSFKVNIPRLKPKEIQSVPVGVDGLNIDKNEVIEIIKPKSLDGDLDACLDYQNERTSQVPFIFWNKKARPVHLKAQNWVLRTPAFDVIVRVAAVKIPPRSYKTTSGTLRGIQWRKFLDIKMPSDLEPDLKLVGFNILKPDQLSLLIKNKGKRERKGASRDWIYIDQNEDPSNDFEDSLHCLIYSFLVMGLARFNNVIDNKILEKIRRNFHERSMNVTLEHAGHEDSGEVDNIQTLEIGEKKASKKRLQKKGLTVEEAVR
jgi:alpha-beta hydrolase superfamily lysophospholipase